MQRDFGHEHPTLNFCSSAATSLRFFGELGDDEDIFPGERYPPCVRSYVSFSLRSRAHRLRQRAYMMTPRWTPSACRRTHTHTHTHTIRVRFVWASFLLPARSFFVGRRAERERERESGRPLRAEYVHSHAKMVAPSFGRRLIAEAD